jgi:GTP cyclohydrolase II
MTVSNRALRADPLIENQFMPTSRERVMRARGDLRLGLPVVVTGPGGALMVLAVEGLSEARFAAAVQAGGAELVLTGRRAVALGSDGAAPVVRLEVGGQSFAQVQRLADPIRDGALRGPVAVPVLPGGVVQEAGIALARAAQLLPSVMSVPLADAGRVAQEQGLTLVSAGDVLTELARMAPQHEVSAAALPMAVSEAGRVHVFRPDDGGAEHYAIEVGAVDRVGPVLVRLHSACFTGDVLGSRKCDCGPQLQAAMAAMAEVGGGVLLYLNQEGRGIGLANKMRAYALQERGLDTVEANHHLGFEDDERDFRIGAALLARLGISEVRLMTNNPAKVAMLTAQGVRVAARVPLAVGRTAQNARYLAVKAQKSGHLLP